MLDTEQAAAKVGVTPRQFWNWYKVGLVPQPEVTPDGLRWNEAALEQWENGLLAATYECNRAENDRRNAGGAWTADVQPPAGFTIQGA